MKILLVRHGQSVSDVEDRYGGSYDDHLTKEGIWEAKELAVKLADKNIEAIFSSPLLRAKETADVIKGQVGCEIKIIHAFRERNRYGFLTGAKKMEAKLRHADEVSKLKSYKDFIPGGEDYDSFRRRVVMAFDDIVNSGFGSVAVVTHGGPINCIFREVLKIGELSKPGHCALFEISREKDKFVLVSAENAELEQ